MDRNIKEAEDRVWSLQLHYSNVLEAAGIVDFLDQKPHISIKHILKRVKPATLRHRMEDLILWRREEEFGTKDFGAFMRELAKQAKQLDKEQESRSRRSFSADVDNSEDSEYDGDDPVKRAKTKKWKSKHRKGDAAQSGKGSKGTKDSLSSKVNPSSSDGGRGKRRKPACLNPRCDGFHFIDSCPNSTEAEKAKLKEDYRAKKARSERFGTGQGNGKTPSNEHRGSIRRLGAAQIDSHSSLFSAVFADGAVESVVLADQGSDTNLLPPDVFQWVKNAYPRLTTIPLQPPHSYSGVGSTGKITCHKKVQLDVSLRIRHGTKLILRGVEWGVSDQKTEFPILGRHVLQAIGCDNKSMLSTACDKNDGIINIPDALAQDAKSRDGGLIAALLEDAMGTYHSHGGEEADALDDSDVYIDLGDDPEEELDAALEKSVLDAEENGLSEQGVGKLRRILQ